MYVIGLAALRAKPSARVSQAIAAGALAVTLVVVGASSTRAGAAGGNGGTPVGAREVVGCTSGSGPAVAAGPRSRRAVALTFDDGPSTAYTPAILAILERLHASATFFEEGKHVTGREALMRRILASGDEIGNHSFNHPRDPGFDQLAATNRLIRGATGFTPCLFRPPYGLVDPKVESAVRRNDLQTVLWSVDSNDDKHPGAGAIRTRVLSLAQPGSIVLMHDGGHHPQTVTALPAIVRGLHARGLSLVTVTQLLGGRFVYRG
jgi:peptidoglycan/xylan/chitin deacetylase (PgdA/CDA1 family)